MKLVILPLILLMFTAVLALAISFGVVRLGDSVDGDFDGSTNIGFNGTQVLDGEESSLSMDEAEFNVNISLGAGLFAWVTSSIAFAGIIGVNVLGSGLAEVSVMALFRFASLYGIWLGFSIPAVAFYLTIPFFGVMVYFILTFFYSYGIIAGGSGLGGSS